MLVQITKFKILNWRHKETTNLFLRAIANESFVTDTGLSIEAHSENTAWLFPLTYNPSDTVDSVVLPTLSASNIFIYSTLDASFNRAATYRFEIVNSRGLVVEILDNARAIQVPAQSPISWDELLRFNFVNFVTLNPLSLKEFVADLIANLSSSTSDSVPRVNVRTFGAVGDGVTNDSLAFNNAIANAKVTGKSVYVPPGEYLVEITEPLTKVKIQGAGFSSVLKARAAGVPVINVSGPSSGVGFVLEKLTIRGAGKTTSSTGHGIFINDSNSAALFTIRDVKIEDCGGKGLFIPLCFNYLIEKVTVDECGDNCFEIQGGNTGILNNCYAQTVASGKVGFRIYNGATVLLSCNGIDNDSGAGAKWGEFGKDIVHNGVNDFFTGTLIGCNIEDFPSTGILLHQGSSINILSCVFTTASAAGNYKAIEAEFVADNNGGYIDGATRFILAGVASWANGTPVHSNGPIFLSNTGKFTTIGDGFSTFGYPYITPKFLPGTSEYLLELSRARILNLEASTVRGNLTFDNKTTDGTPTRIIFNNDGSVAEPLVSRSGIASGLLFAGNELQLAASGNLVARYRPNLVVSREQHAVVENVNTFGTPPGVEPGRLDLIGSDAGVAFWRISTTQYISVPTTGDRYIVRNRVGGIQGEQALDFATEGIGKTFSNSHLGTIVRDTLVVAPDVAAIGNRPGVEHGNISVLGSNASLSLWRTSTSSYIQFPTIGDRFILENRNVGVFGEQSFASFTDGIGYTFKNSELATALRGSLFVAPDLSTLGTPPSSFPGYISVLGGGAGVWLWRTSTSSLISSPAVGDRYVLENRNIGIDGEQSFAIWTEGPTYTFKSSHLHTIIRRHLIIAPDVGLSGTQPFANVNGRLQLLGTAPQLTLWKTNVTSFPVTQSLGDYFLLFTDSFGTFIMQAANNGSGVLNVFTINAFGRCSILGLASSLGLQARNTNISPDVGIWRLFVFDDGATRQLRMVSPNGTVNTIANLTL